MGGPDVLTRREIARLAWSALGREARAVRVPVWVLPNPSGLNAHYTVDGLAAEFARLREVTG